MTKNSPRIYTYKITFEEVPYYYYGVHKERKYDEYYMGSPVTHKWCWDFYTPKKQILQFFDFTDEGWLEANNIERRIIKPILNDDLCLNVGCAGSFSLKSAIKAGRIGGIKSHEMGIGVHGRTPEQRKIDAQKGGIVGGKIAYKMKVGVHNRTPEQRKMSAQKAGIIGGKVAKELGVGIHGRTEEQKIEDGRKGGIISAKNHMENGTGLFGMTQEQKIEAGRKGGRISGKRNYEQGIGLASISKEKRKDIVSKTNSQKWECCETGYVSTAAGVAAYQKARGIDTSKSNRRRII